MHSYNLWNECIQGYMHHQLKNGFFIIHYAFNMEVGFEQPQLEVVVDIAVDKVVVALPQLAVAPPLLEVVDKIRL